ncbi:hypothetical protein MMC14_008118 [Varicellaria rhodocarpa]|nr:hypothetical protein [Varicellaria rhodocarpa]
MTEKELQMENTHMGYVDPSLDIYTCSQVQDHCLEYWREAAMCRGDPTLATFSWVNGTILKSRVYSDHECVDWKKLEGWATSRMVDLSDYSILEKDPRHRGSLGDPT